MLPRATDPVPNLRALACAALLILLSPCPVQAADEPPATILTRFPHASVRYDVQLDGSYTETRAWEQTVLDARALAGAKETAVSYSQSVASLEVLEAYTLKPGGKRIYVPKSNFHNSSEGGKAGTSPLFSDQATLTTMFPDVEVGDTLVFSYQLKVREPIFPHSFSIYESFSPGMAVDDASVVVTAPDALVMHNLVTELRPITPPFMEAGFRAWAWHYENPSPKRDPRTDYTVVDLQEAPSLLMSTFPNYRAIAEAYGLRARPRAQPTGRIRKLAAEIAAGKATPRDQAQALYEWVARNISNGGNCMSLGAVVPRETDLVLDNHTGDCKDHATLLQALLAAENIESTQALVNAGAVYTLPGIPVVSTVNHVINYVPQLDLFLDSTASDTPFGMLPRQDQAKPVLLVDHYRDGLLTPAAAVGSNEEISDTRMRILPDGSISAKVDIRERGSYAVAMRAAMRHLPAEREARLIPDSFRARGLTATGTFSKDDPQALSDEYHFGADFEVKKAITRPGAGAFPIQPLFSGAAPVARFLFGANQLDSAGHDFACGSGHSVEHYSIEIPEGMQITSIPDNADVQVAPVSYHARYKLDGRTLTVERSIDDRTVAGVCKPAIAAAYRALAEQAMPNFQAQVLYK